MIRNPSGRFQILAVVDKVYCFGFDEGYLFFGEIDIVDMNDLLQKMLAFKLKIVNWSQHF